ncbi:hypothetical protein [Arcobacter sp. CECT 8985]|uniref:hypothetical protein n=1 Tax=Arcobacter sp. CECT 8985 TaxID=1935424 RepID=UPI00100A9712|nr:hypothetical protein [Arcobacter sp. CECT 8985]RXJ86839.1 hypothetical protein CRU93_06450 [Arcobacter sp. CECT 8985]
MNINFNKLLKILNPFIYTLSISYLFCFILFLLLPAKSIKQNIALNNSLEYLNFDGFYTKQSNTNTNVIANSSLKNNFVLKATYVKANNQGYILFFDKSANRSIVLSKNESYKNFKLIEISKNYVIFNKNGENFSLFIKNELQNLPILNNQTENNIKEVSKKDINFYSKNIEKIWQNIAIEQLKKDNKIIGFLITKINNNSIFSQLGLKEGDILKAVNNNNLKSYNDAFKIYNNIKNLQYLKLKILRKNKKMELEYEIN